MKKHFSNFILFITLLSSEIIYLDNQSARSFRCISQGCVGIISERHTYEYPTVKKDIFSTFAFKSTNMFEFERTGSLYGLAE